MKFLLVSGGVISGIGKGILASSTGVLLKNLGLNVTAIKIDPYLNIDAGLMNPTEHGEVYVMNDGGEVDLDLGNYERFLDIELTSNNNITTGKIYNKVISDEREGKYLGKTVQVVPHITNAIKKWIVNIAHIPDCNDNISDVCIIELGGTIGDIESAPFVEALRQLKRDVGYENFCLIHVTLVPIINGEQKSKPTQSTIKDLRGLGLIPDLIACRCEVPVEQPVKNKISMFCDVSIENIISVHNCPTIYEVPGLLQRQEICKVLQKKLKLNCPILEEDGDLMKKWTNMANKYSQYHESDATIRIGIVGKYTQLADSYFSISKSLEHASLSVQTKVKIVLIESSNLEKEKSNDVYDKSWADLTSCDAIIVPGGFGQRGVEGKIVAIQYARQNKIPFLGICLGMQLAVVEYSRSVLGLTDANSTEIDPNTCHPVVVYMPEIDKNKMGGTQRLGARTTKLISESKTKNLYDNVDSISERHRHRYEINIEYVPQLEEKGMHFVGHDTTKERMEVLELDDHPYFIGVQFHPEYKSRPLNPAPLFVGLLEAIYDVDLSLKLS